MYSCLLACVWFAVRVVGLVDSVLVLMTVVGVVAVVVVVGVVVVGLPMVGVDAFHPVETEVTNCVVAVVRIGHGGHLPWGNPHLCFLGLLSLWWTCRCMRQSVFCCDILGGSPFVGVVGACWDLNVVR